METTILRAGGESEVTIYHHGAHITSWKDSRGQEKIYTSPTAILDGSKAIRGGIPICFPQFAKRGALRQHGFARNTTWALEQATEQKATFVLQESAETIAEWGHKFRAVYSVELGSDGDELDIKLEVLNTGEEEFKFTCALHSYFCCQAEQVVLGEYDGLQYEDSTDGMTQKVQQGDIHFGQEVDRVYRSTPNKLSVPTAGLTLTKSNLPDAVVWNPYQERAKQLGDLPDNGWLHFVCIEPARVYDEAAVAPAQEWTCQLVLKSTH